MRTAGGEFGIESMAAACLNGAREQAAYVLHARSASAALFVARERSRVDLFTACVSRTLEESTFGVSPEPHGLTSLQAVLMVVDGMGDHHSRSGGGRALAGGF